MNEDTSSEVASHAYSHPAPNYDPTLINVGKGRPGGELLRRYWQPFALAGEATNVPRKIRLLGEDLILFRPGNGVAGLLYPRCMHRGTNLFFGRVEDDGIRCCYHGWKYDVVGRCLDQPAEPGGGRQRARVRQPWYPVVERYGAIWAYMGPPDKQPVFPRFSIFENMTADEEVLGYYLTRNGELAPWPEDFCFFALYENALDTHHVPILHTMISGPQFSGNSSAGRQSVNFPKVQWKSTENGVVAIAERNLPDCSRHISYSEALMPNLISLAPFFTKNGPGNELFWVVPWDDDNHTVLMMKRQKKGTPAPDNRKIFTFGPDGKYWSELTPEEHQRYPGDYEAEASMGKHVMHSEEHLVTSDFGVALLRRRFREQAKVVADGGDPVGVSFDPNDIFKINSAAVTLAPEGVSA